MPAILMWHPVVFSLVMHALGGTLRHAGLVDYFDVAAVAILIYLALRWIRRARAVRVLQGILIVGLLYTVAQQAGLVLTTSLFRGLLTVTMVSIASLFQEDLRHFFERLTVYRQDAMHRRTLQALLRSVRHFSKRHIGALIVLKGRDPLERHSDAGQILNGRVSAALLDSLFDPHSDGHDGAVIVDGDFVARFGVHLPLSKNVDPDSGLGTRHAAALGLSELTDAICLVVSETRGSLMVAREGRFVNLGDGHELEAILNHFILEKYQTPMAARTWKTLWKHPVDKGIALMMGVALWLFFVKGLRPAEREFALPVRLAQVPAGLQLDAIVPPQAMITVRGLEKDLRDFQPNSLIPLQVPSASRRIQNVTLTTNLVQLPKNLQAAAISPGAVSVRFHSFSPSKKTANAMLKSPKPSKHAWFKFR